MPDSRVLSRLLGRVGQEARPPPAGTLRKRCQGSLCSENNTGFSTSVRRALKNQEAEDRGHEGEPPFVNTTVFSNKKTTYTQRDAMGVRQQTCWDHRPFLGLVFRASSARGLNLVLF